MSVRRRADPWIALKDAKMRRNDGGKSGIDTEGYYLAT
jgi:hypothetical protein